MEIEICANSFRSAKIAAATGVNRIELCQSLELGGVTPSAGDIRIAVALKEKYNFQVYVLIRPRGGDFCFAPEELEVMQEDILFCKNNGVDGVVLGALTTDGKVDIEGIKSLKNIAGEMGLTFHRAFDYVNDPFETLEDIINLGFQRILTSGQQKTAMEGKEVLKKLIEKAGNRISIMPGGGINEQNIKALMEYTGAREVHFSAREMIKSPFENNKGATLNNSGIPELDYWLTSKKRIESIRF